MHFGGGEREREKKQDLSWRSRRGGQKEARIKRSGNGEGGRGEGGGGGKVSLLHSRSFDRPSGGGGPGRPSFSPCAAAGRRACQFHQPAPLVWLVEIDKSGQGPGASLLLSFLLLCCCFKSHRGGLGCCLTEPTLCNLNSSPHKCDSSLLVCFQAGGGRFRSRSKGRRGNNNKNQISSVRKSTAGIRAARAAPLPSVARSWHTGLGD